MPKYDFSLPDNQSRLDEMQQELTALEGERSKMRKWKEREWYSDRFQDVPRPKKEGPVLVENPEQIDFSQANTRYQFTCHIPHYTTFRKEYWARPLQRALMIAGSIVLAGILVALFPSQTGFIIGLSLVGVGLITAIVLHQRLSVRVGLLNHMSVVQYELTPHSLYRQVNYGPWATIELHEIKFREEIEEGLLVSSSNLNGIPVKAHQGLEDPGCFLIPVTQFGYVQLKAWLTEGVN